MRSKLWAAVGLGIVSLGGLVAFAQAPAPKTGDQPADTKPASKKPGDGLPDILGGLKKSPGCLGVEAAQTKSGKNVIFAWFKDKKAVVAWYESGFHQKLMDRFPDREDREPLEGIADGTGPIMVIASMTMANKPQFTQTSMPISQIAIELYQPLPGGAYLGSRFAPASVQVPHMRAYEK